ncbi:MAG: DinB family protein [Vicinamibacterales bacterium]
MSRADDLLTTVDAAAARLHTVSDARASVRPRSDAWSAKEILGHLVDSAANNHQRFVRALHSSELHFPGYEPDEWLRVQAWSARPWTEVIEFWRLFNHHVSHIIRHVPATALPTPCHIGHGEPVTLGFLIDDYFAHLAHHLRQIDERLEQA